MKILFLGQSLNEYSGWGRYAWEVAKRLRERCQVKVLTEEDSGKECEIPALRKSGNFWSAVRNIRLVKKMAKKFDAVHALDGWPYAVYAAFSGRPYFVTAVGTYAVAPLDQPWKSILLKKAYRRARRILCISNFTKNEITRRISLPNLAVVHLGVDQKLFRDLNFKRDPKLIAAVGAVKPRKGYHVALAAIKILTNRFPEIRFVIAGSLGQSEYVQSLKSFIAANGFEKNVEFAPDLSHEDLVKLYNRAAVFLLLPQNLHGHFEGFGLVFLEAQACGLPVVGTRQNGDEDAIVEGQTGFLVEQDDPAAAAGAVEKILSDEKLRRGLSREAVKFAVNFSWDKTAEKYLEAYRHAAI